MPKHYTICKNCKKINRYDAERAPQAACPHCKTALGVKSSVVEASAGELAAIIAKSPVPVVVDFWAPWCGPCRSFAPIFESLANERSEQAMFVKLNTEDHPEASSQFVIRGIPTTMVFKGGRELTRQSGAMDLRSFGAWLRNLSIS